MASQIVSPLRPDPRLIPNVAPRLPLTRTRLLEHLVATRLSRHGASNRRCSNESHQHKASVSRGQALGTLTSRSRFATPSAGSGSPTIIGSMGDRIVMGHWSRVAPIASRASTVTGAAREARGPRGPHDLRRGHRRVPHRPKGHRPRPDAVASRRVPRIGPRRPTDCDHCRLASFSSTGWRPTLLWPRRTSAPSRLAEHAGVDVTVVPIWLEHESVATPQNSIHPGLGFKDQALGRSAPLGTGERSSKLVEDLRFSSRSLSAACGQGDY